MSRSSTKLWATGPISKLAQNRLRHLKCIFAFLHNLSSLVLNIANICAAAARAVCSCVVWASGDYRTRYLKGARMQLFWTLDSTQQLCYRYQQNLHENTGRKVAAGQNWSTDIFNGNKKLAAMCHRRFCFQASLIHENGRKLSKIGIKLTWQMGISSVNNKGAELPLLWLLAGGGLINASANH